MLLLLLLNASSNNADTCFYFSRSKYESENVVSFFLSLYKNKQRGYSVMPNLCFDLVVKICFLFFCDHFHNKISIRACLFTGSHTH